MASTYSISGLASGLDWSTMISQLVELQRRPITLLEGNKATLSEKKTAWGEVNTMLLSLKTAAGSLNSLNDFNLYKPSATVSGTSRSVGDLMSFAVGTNASEGTYDITVTQLAKAQKLVSGGFGSTTEALGISGDLVINGRVLSLAGTDSLATIQSKINALNSGEDPAGVTASIMSVSSGEYRLTLTSKTTGAQGMSLENGSGSDVLAQLGLVEIVAGQDAVIMVDGFTITRSTNQISDVIGGVTLNLLGEDEGATITLDITRDNDGVKKKIQEFVDSYNKLESYIDKQNTVSGDGKTTGTLFADSTLRSVLGTLKKTILSEVSGLDSTLNHLSLIGISIDRTGQLSIDDTVLDGYLETNFDDVVDLFAARGRSTSSELTYVFSGVRTVPGDYEVEITQVATRASVTGSGFSGSLSSDVALDFTAPGGSAKTITLSAGSDITAIVGAINADSSLGVIAEDIGGQLRLTSTSYGSTGFTLSVTGGDIGIADGTYTGLDVAGRIRQQGSSEWMTMTGRGRTLTGDAGQDVDGLAMLYTGTSTGVMDFSFFEGICSKLDKALYSMTDSVDGFVATRQKTLQGQMDKIDKKIENMEVRLSRYQETMIAKYAAMESMLNTLQSQQSWLSSQISSLTGNK